MNVQVQPVADRAATPVLPDPYRAAGIAPRQTGPFVHDPAHKAVVSFRTDGDAERSFTVLIAMGHREKRAGCDGRSAVNLSRNGIAIIDNDNWTILAESIYGQASGIAGASIRQKEAFGTIGGLCWSDFSHFLRSCDGYRAGRAIDIDSGAARPAPGNFDNRVRLGLARAEDRDIRDAFVRAVHASGDLSLPRVTRRGAVAEIMAHATARTRNGISLAWDVSTDYSWDVSGEMPGREEVDPAFDGRWLLETRRGDVVAAANDAILSVYIDEPFCALGIDEAPADLEMSPDGRSILLAGFQGREMTFASTGDLSRHLSSMDDTDLLSVWVAVRSLDADLSCTTRAFGMRMELNRVRAELEAGWADEVESELDFG